MIRVNPSDDDRDTYSDLVEKMDGRPRPRVAAAKAWLCYWLIRIVERRDPGEFDTSVFDEPTPTHERGSAMWRILAVLVAFLLTLGIFMLKDPNPGAWWGVHILEWGSV